jgi:imidazolonepropionase-like amidohydrolase
MVKVGYAGDRPAEFAPVVRAVVEEAKREGLPVVMHAEELAAAKMALASGVQVLAHTISDRVVDDELVSLAKEKGAIFITGLAHFDAYRQVLDQSRELLPIEKRCGDPDVVATWSDLSRIPLAARPPMPPSIRWGSSPEGRRTLLENVRRLHEAGVPIAVGTNGGNVGTLQGPSFHRELRMLAEAGIPLADVLVAATRNGALALGLAAERGTLQAGKAADFVVLEENPLASVDAFAAIRSLWVSGRRVEPRRAADPGGAPYSALAARTISLARDPMWAVTMRK